MCASADHNNSALQTCLGQVQASCSSAWSSSVLKRPVYAVRKGYPGEEWFSALNQQHQQLVMAIILDNSCNGKSHLSWGACLHLGPNAGSKLAPSLRQRPSCIAIAVNRLGILGVGVPDARSRVKNHIDKTSDFRKEEVTYFFEVYDRWAPTNRDHCAAAKAKKTRSSLSQHLLEPPVA